MSPVCEEAPGCFRYSSESLLEIASFTIGADDETQKVIHIYSYINYLRTI